VSVYQDIRINSDYQLGNRRLPSSLHIVRGITSLTYQSSGFMQVTSLALNKAIVKLQILPTSQAERIQK
jgi:hypothetical protein